jgi:hypothetical protein
VNQLKYCFLMLLGILASSAFADQTHEFCIGEYDYGCKVQPRYGCDHNNAAGVRAVAATLCGGVEHFQEKKTLERDTHDGNTCGYKTMIITCDGTSSSSGSGSRAGSGSASLSCVRLGANRLTQSMNGIVSRVDATVTNSCSGCARVDWNFFQDSDHEPYDSSVNIAANSTATITGVPTKFGNLSFRLLRVSSCQ